LVIRPCVRMTGPEWAMPNHLKLNIQWVFQ
jgi:hypothetical protein